MSRKKGGDINKSVRAGMHVPGRDENFLVLGRGSRVHKKELDLNSSNVNWGNKKFPGGSREMT